MTSSEDILTLLPPKADARLSYGADENQCLDVRLPKARPSQGLAIFIHGGFWRSRYGLGYAGHLCAALTAKGIATANIEYRRVGNAGGGWPGTFSDVRMAYRFLRQKGNDHGLEIGETVVIGHSAGSQLALCLAAHEPDVNAVVSLAGVVDLQRAYTLHLSNNAVVEFLGGTPAEVADHYQEADPMKLKIEARQWMVHGSKDDIVPPLFSRDYVEAKRKAKENAELVAIPDAGHFELVDPRSAACEEVQRSVTAALGKN
jgi:acetyl esterase/lipase